MTLRKANEHRNAWFEGVQKCHLDETLFTVMERIVRAEVHRLVVVDENEKVIGIISLSDILLYLVLQPSGDGVGGNAQSLRASDPIARKVSSLDGSDSLSNSRSIDNIEEEEVAELVADEEGEQKVVSSSSRGERRISEVTGAEDEEVSAQNGEEKAVVEEGEAATEEEEEDNGRPEGEVDKSSGKSLVGNINNNNNSQEDVVSNGKAEEGEDNSSNSSNDNNNLSNNSNLRCEDIREMAVVNE